MNTHVSTSGGRVCRLLLASASQGTLDEHEGTASSGGVGGAVGVAPLSEDELVQQLVGKVTIQKLFPNYGYFSGLIESYDNGEKLFHVRYEDDDEEELRFVRCCGVMRCVVVCGSVMQCASQCVAVCSSVLHYAAVCCNLFQCVALCRIVSVCCSALQYVAMCCSVLQCIAVCCSVLQCVAVYCSI